VNEYNVAADYYREFLPDVADFISDRGLTPADAAYARIGYVGDPMPGHEQYKGRLVIPYITGDDTVRDLRFRALNDIGPKYLSLPNTKPRLYNSRCLVDGPETVVVCEGELDALIVRSTCGMAAVGIPGANHFTGNPHWATLLNGVPKVIIATDGDDAGRKLGREIAKAVRTSRTVPMPDGMDVNDYLLQRGSEELIDLLGV